MYPSAVSIILVGNFYIYLKCNNTATIFYYLKFAIITNLLIYNIFLSRQLCYMQVFIYTYICILSSNYTLQII